MANPEHLAILRRGATSWNMWRRAHPSVVPDLSQEVMPDLPELSFFHADLHGANLRGLTLLQPNFNGADLREADLRDANFIDPLLIEADFSSADLRGASVINAHARSAKFNDANCHRLTLHGADLWKATFLKADLRESDLSRTHLLNTDFSGADLSGSYVYGVAAWDVVLTDTKQDDLVISEITEATKDGVDSSLRLEVRDPRITVDSLEVAQFIYLLLSNQRIRHVIDTITSKVVLILGRFTDERKQVLDTIRAILRTRDYLPILFDFDEPSSRDLMETVSTLAHLSRFIIADITDPRSVPAELERIVPSLPSVPVQPLLHASADGYAMFPRRFPWVMPILRYGDQKDVAAVFDGDFLQTLEDKVTECRPR
jgi:uncharacterized protein YjbI with pentapeptide repeats